MERCQSECGCNSGDHAAKGPANREEAIALLEKFHQFPCDYQFKVIGYADKRLLNDVKSAAENVLGPLDDDGAVSGKASSQGRYESITVEAMMQSAEQVLEVYAALRQVSGLVSIF